MTDDQQRRIDVSWAMHYAFDELNEAGREFGAEEYQRGARHGFECGLLVGLVVVAAFCVLAFTLSSVLTELAVLWR